jgi:hypothetical protein
MLAPVARADVALAGGMCQFPAPATSPQSWCHGQRAAIPAGVGQDLLMDCPDRARESARLAVGRAVVRCVLTMSFVLASSAVVVPVSRPGIDGGYVSLVTIASVLAAALFGALRRGLLPEPGSLTGHARALALAAAGSDAVGWLVALLALVGTSLIVTALTA